MRGCSSASAAPFCHGATVLNPPGREKDPYPDPWLQSFRPQFATTAWGVAGAVLDWVACTEGCLGPRHHRPPNNIPLGVPLHTETRPICPVQCP